MTLQQLNYVLTIAKYGSLNKAAEALYITQPSLTSSLKELERELGIEIFYRNSRGVTPTADGEEFLTGARQLYRQYELLAEKYESGNVKRKFSVSTQHYSFADEAFVNTVKKFGTSQYDFSILETKTRWVIADVAELRSEVGILYISDYNRRYIGKILKKNDLKFTPLTDCKAYVYLHKNHPLAGRKSIGLEELQDYPCVMFNQGEEGSSYFAEEILSDAPYERIIHTSDRATNLNLMKALDAFTLCSGIISNELNGSEFTVVPFREDTKHKNTVMTIGYITRDRSIRSEVGEVFIEELKKILGKDAEEELAPEE
ncbi:MAG: LysR family transcriptional regulator [Eubacteriales bacterium]|jgi:DNA-binding transcriptional LysR family regulator